MKSSLLKSLDIGTPPYFLALLLIQLLPTDFSSVARRRKSDQGDQASHHEDPAPGHGHRGAYPDSGGGQEGDPLQLWLGQGVLGRKGGQSFFETGYNPGHEESREELPCAYMWPQAQRWPQNYATDRKAEELKESPIIGCRGLWQRSSRRVGISL